MDMNENVFNKLKDFIDAFETEYGDVEGFEVSLEHPILDGERQEFADIKEFVVRRIVREEIKTPSSKMG
jgi:hypothetical protein